ncbi:MAG TPA: hypothetical protein VLZ83_11100 [Edaphocola sp.]|nr:hypothetical protein [Edaphocola sp.]
MKYKPIASLNTKFEKQIRYGITTLIVIMIVPSFYLAYNLFNKKKYSEKVEDYITKEFTNKGYLLIFKNTKYNNNPKKIEVAFLTKVFTDNEIKELQEKLSTYQLDNTELVIRQDTKDLKSEILNEIGNQNKSLSEKDILINNLQQELGEYKVDDTELLSELKILFPDIKIISVGKQLQYAHTDSAQTMTILVYNAEKEIQKLDADKIQSWLKIKLKTNQVALLKQEITEL